MIVALIFGTKKLRNIGSDLGGAVKGFKESISSEEETEEASEISNEKDQKKESEK